MGFRCSGALTGAQAETRHELMILGTRIQNSLVIFNGAPLEQAMWAAHIRRRGHGGQ